MLRYLILSLIIDLGFTLDLGLSPELGSPPDLGSPFVRGPLTFNPNSLLYSTTLPSFTFRSLFDAVPRLGSDTARKTPTPRRSAP